MNIDSFWEYSDPVASEERFRDALAQATDDERLELRTQIARTYSLRRQFDEAHAQLNEIELLLANAGPRPRLRYLLERGRAYNSAGDHEQARDRFVRAWEMATSQGEDGQGEDGLAVDAAHMVAITYGGSAEAIAWNEKGIALARRSDAPKAKALLPAMLNNSAWDQHDRGEHAKALPLFQQALAAWEATGKSRPTQIAKWSVARCLRSLHRYEAALAILGALEEEYAQQAITDGYLYEEIAENLLALARPIDATPYFRKAANALAEDAWLVEHEAARLARLQQLAENIK